MARRESGSITADIQEFLEELGRLLVEGNSKAIAAMWGVPALVVHDDGVRAIQSTEEVEKFFEGAKDQYNARGITSTYPEVQATNWISDRVVIVEVRWPWVDANGKSRGYETSTYTLRRDDGQALKLHVAVMHGAEVDDR